MVKSADRVNQELREFIKIVTSYYDIFAIVLFGSYARGMAGEYSDIDLAVFSDDFGENPLEDMKKLYKLRRIVDTDIEPLPFRKEAYFEHDESDFVNEIITKGKIIYKEGEMFI